MNWPAAPNPTNQSGPGYMADSPPHYQMAPVDPNTTNHRHPKLFAGATITTLILVLGTASYAQSERNKRSPSYSPSENPAFSPKFGAPSTPAQPPLEPLDFGTP
jgi:hypothetical protein